MSKVPATKHKNHEPEIKKLAKPISNLSKDSISNSVKDTLKSLTKGKRSDTEIASARPSEDILYTSIVHAQLKDIKPNLAERLLKSLPKETKENQQSKLKQPLFLATQEILDRAVKRGEISKADVKQITVQAFGKAQVDSDAKNIARRVPKAELTTAGGVDGLVDKMMQNDVFEKKNFQSFNKQLEKNKLLTPEQVKQQRSLMKDIFAVTKKEVSPDGPVPVTPKVEDLTETDKTAPTPSSKDIKTSPNDFAYKPESEKDGKLLLQIPISLAPDIDSARIIFADGNFYDLNFTGVGNDGRSYFRGDKSGKDFKGAGKIELGFRTGGVGYLELPDLQEFHSQGN